MMVGMMVPTAVPMFITYGAVSRRTPAGHAGRVMLFVLGYVALWTAFALTGSTVQAMLREAGHLGRWDGSNRPVIAASSLAVAGLYQLSPLKQVCLRRCRTPLGFLLMEWRPGLSGALRLGLRHGIDCVLCCWALMGLMFVVGTMNLLWMGGLTLVMFTEKVMPRGQWVGRAAGVVLLGAAVWVMVRAM
jgi:predicted metal-binding membrane protein